MNDSTRPNARPGVSRRAVLSCLAGTALAAATAQAKPPTNPRWYGFNLLEYFSTDPDWMSYFPYQADGMFVEDDFRWIRDWGFNWVRLPMDYRFWTGPDLMTIDGKKVEPVDRAIRLGEKYGIHVNVALHRAPGYCCLDVMDRDLTGIRVTPEKTSVYTDARTLEAFVNQWTFFAKRYKGIASERVSFNLVNEPSVHGAKGRSLAEQRAQYARVARAAVAGIREYDPARTIVTDGFPGGVGPVPELFDTGIVQSGRGYGPGLLTHHRCEWARTPELVKDPAPVPTWPLHDKRGNVTADLASLEKSYEPWVDAKKRVPIQFGEMGCYKHTPPVVVNAWYDDLLDIFNRLDAGFALWNFRGPFGVLDTDRAGTKFEDWHGHKLDRALLTVLQRHVRA